MPTPDTPPAAPTPPPAVPSPVDLAIGAPGESLPCLQAAVPLVAPPPAHPHAGWAVAAALMSVALMLAVVVRPQRPGGADGTDCALPQAHTEGARAASRHGMPRRGRLVDIP